MERRLAGSMLVILALLLSLTGIALIYTASHRVFGSQLAFRQLGWLVVGLTVAAAINFLDPTIFYRFRWIFYFAGLLLLVLTLFYGHEARGGRRWLSLGYFNLQPSEPMKFFLLLVIAGISEKFESARLGGFRAFFQVTFAVIIPVLLLFLQPNLGMVLVYLVLLIGWFFLMGWRKEGLTIILFGTGLAAGMIMIIHPKIEFLQKTLETLVDGYWQLNLAIFASVLFILFFAVLAPYLRKKRIGLSGFLAVLIVGLILGALIVPHLAPYQRGRLESYIDPFSAAQTGGYSLIQSQIAIGSGGWLGKGYMEGTQSQLGFIPELWTDFIFTVAVEELGMLFATVILLGYLFLLYSLFSTAVLADGWWKFYFTTGAGIIWIFHLMIGTGMATGLTPITGLPLPFLSYGGSFMVTNWALVGLIISFNRDYS